MGDDKLEELEAGEKVEGLYEDLGEEAKDLEEDPDGEKKVEPEPESGTFTLPEDEKPETSEADLREMEIVHNGNVHKFTKEKIIELAQKGFDYDTKVGPHGKIAQMIEQDPEVANVVNKYWQEKTQPEKFKVKPMDDYEDETEWLADNMDKHMKNVPTPQPAKQSLNVMESLRMRDPEHCSKILPKLGEYATRLSVRDYQKIDQDMGALCQFYDFVKEKELTKAPAPKTPKTPGFRVKSGGAAATKAEAVPVWKMSKADFQKQLDKIKGY